MDTWSQEKSSFDEENEMHCAGERWVHAMTSMVVPNGFLLRFSSLNYFIRVTAFCLRWLPGSNRARDLTREECASCELEVTPDCPTTGISGRIPGAHHWIQVVFKSALSTLRPFVLANGLIRVSGRLAQSPLDYIERHPIVLPQKSPLTMLLVRKAHILALHGGS